jgi:hypothetical protein
MAGLSIKMPLEPGIAVMDLHIISLVPFNLEEPNEVTSERSYTLISLCA